MAGKSGNRIKGRSQSFRDLSRCMYDVEYFRAHSDVAIKSELLTFINPALKARIVRDNGDMVGSIRILQGMLSPKGLKRKAVMAEIISTYILFGDIEGAYVRMQSITVSSPDLDRLRLYLRMYGHPILCSDPGTEANRKAIIELLRREFDSGLYLLYLRIVQIGCKNNGCFGDDCMKVKLEEIKKTIQSYEYTETLSYEECRTILKKMEIDTVRERINKMELLLRRTNRRDPREPRRRRSEHLRDFPVDFTLFKKWKTVGIDGTHFKIL